MNVDDGGKQEISFHRHTVLGRKFSGGNGKKAVMAVNERMLSQ